MNILIVGSGGREHALAIAYAKSNRVKYVFVAPGNDFMKAAKIKTLPKIGVLNFKEIIAFTMKNNIDLVDVAQDDPLSKGLVDTLTEKGIPAFGPNKNASEIEWNKAWSREFMKKYNLPIPHFEIFTSQKDGVAFIKKMKHNSLLFVKAAGLAGGKGVIRTETKEEVISAIKKMGSFGNAGKTFVLEEGMVGQEFSLFAMCDGDYYQIISSAQDHKRVFTGDQGPNTGGMGCISPSGRMTKPVTKTIQKTILDPFITGMRAEGRPYVGILYVGGIMTKKGPQIVEFNARWGDPEAEVILPGIISDYASIIEAVIMDRLEKVQINHDGKVRISIAGCASGYPLDYNHVLGKKIYGLEKARKLPGIQIFGAGIRKKGKHYRVNGGRIFHLVSEGKDIFEARESAYRAMSYISVEDNLLHFRTDIGWQEVMRHTL